MQIVHMSTQSVEKNAASGVFLKTLIKVTTTKTTTNDKEDSTKGTYKVRLGQAMKYLLTYNLTGMDPGDWDENQVQHFKNAMLSPPLDFCSDVVRRVQDLVFETLEQCRRDGYNFVMPQKAKYERNDKPPVWCTPEEVDLLRNYEFASETLSRVRDLFLIQCFSGLSYCDLRRLDRKQVTSIDGIPVIQDNRQKVKKRAKKPFTIPLIPQLKQLLDKYDWRLPLLSNVNYNKYLKEIAKIVGIHKPLKTHDGRRTCAMYYLSMTGDYHIPAAVLGNSPEMVRKRYAPYLPMHLIEALKRSNIFRKTA